MKAFRPSLDTQRDFLVELPHEHAEFTAYVFNPTWTDLRVLFLRGAF
jgi:hypothetical protein